jgi:hypothetical protein
MAGGAAAAELKLAEPVVCSSADELSFSAERALGRALADAAPLELLVNVERDPAGVFRARLEISDAALAGGVGLRTFSAASCDELVDTVALAIALALGSRPDREAPVRAEAAPSLPASATARATPATPAPPDAPLPEDASGNERAATRVAARGWLVGDSGSLPRAGLGVAVGVSVGWPGFGLLALGTFLPRQEDSVDRAPGSPGVEMMLLAASLSGCVPLGAARAPVALDVCAGWELGQLSGDGVRVDIPRHRTSLWSAARLDVGARWRVPNSAFGVELLITAAAPLTRDEFILQDIGGVHRPANVVGRAALGVSWSIE